MKKKTLLASAVTALLALPHCYREVDIAGVKGAPCGIAADSCRWPYVCGADGTCRFPHAESDAAHDAPTAQTEPGDAPADTPADPLDAADAADAADGPAAEVEPQPEVGALPQPCNNNDKLCAPGICVIDRCNYDVLDIPYVPLSELPQVTAVSATAWDFGFVTQHVKHRIRGDADVEVPDGEAGSFQMVWNEVGLFARVDVKDSNLVADSFTGEDPVFDDDDVEIYVDVHGDERSSMLSGPYNQVMFGYGRPKPRNYTKSARRPGISFALAPTHGGYVVQAAMEWNHLDGTAVPGAFIGLDVHINDDDDGGGRDRKWAWFDTPHEHDPKEDDRASENPRAIGRARLSPCGPKGCIGDPP